MISNHSFGMRAYSNSLSNWSKIFKNWAQRSSKAIFPLKFFTLGHADFNEVKFINSEGIGYLLEVNNFLAKKDKKLVVVGVNAYVDDIFQTIGIRDIVAVYKNVDDFLKQ